MKEAVTMDCGCVSHDGGHHHDLCPVPGCGGILIGEPMACETCGRMEEGGGMSRPSGNVRATGSVIKATKRPCQVCGNESESFCSACGFCVLCHIVGRFGCLQISEYTYLDRLPPELQKERACRECGSKATTGVKEGHRRPDEEFYLCCKHFEEYEGAEK